jgi:hypothetical protein
MIDVLEVAGAIAMIGVLVYFYFTAEDRPIKK